MVETGTMGLLDQMKSMMMTSVSSLSSILCTATRKFAGVMNLNFLGYAEPEDQPIEISTSFPVDLVTSNIPDLKDYLFELDAFSDPDPELIRHYMENGRLEVSLDVHLYTRDQIKATVSNGMINVVGKQKEFSEDGSMMTTRKFKRAYRLPEGVDGCSVYCILSNGVLTIFADSNHNNTKNLTTKLPAKADVSISSNLRQRRPLENAGSKRSTLMRNIIGVDVKLGLKSDAAVKNVSMDECNSLVDDDLRSTGLL